MGIGACDHQARERGILIKIGAACLPNEVAYDTCYSKKGVATASDASGVTSFWTKKEIGPTENKRKTAFFMDFTVVQCPGNKCRRIMSIVLHTFGSEVELEGHNPRKTDVSGLQVIPIKEDQPGTAL